MVPSALRAPAAPHFYVSKFTIHLRVHKKMKNTTNNTQFPSTVEEEISSLQQHISTYRATLNQEGVWLFLATLGCWSVTASSLKFLAFALAAFLFGHRFTNQLSETASFSQMVKRLQERISTSLPDNDSRKARLYDLSEIQRNELSTLNSLRNTWVFLLCWLFWGGSLLYVSWNF